MSTTPKEDEGLFETIGKTADMIGETSVGKKIGAVLSVMLLALLSGGANLAILDDYLNGEEEVGPEGGCMQHDATNYNPEATFDDGTCNFLVIIYGCTNEAADNYNAQATHDDGRCIVPDDNNTTNETTEEAVYGCTDPEANNYNDKATEDDGSCDYEDEYEEPECNSTSAHFYPAWQNSEGNQTVYYVNNDTDANNSMSILTDIDADCDDKDLQVLLYLDVYHNETGQYYYSDIYYNISGHEWDNHWLNMSWQELNETNGTWQVWVSMYVWNKQEEEWEYAQYFGIDELLVTTPEEEE